METIDIEGIGDNVPIIIVPETVSDFISEDGRYFVDGIGLLAEFHRMVHDLLDVIPTTEDQQPIADAASGFVHEVLNVMRGRIETTTLSAKMARSFDA